MKSWRLAWTLAEIFDPSNIAKHSRALRSPWKFWAALVLKFVPFVWPFPIQLGLRQGGTVTVREFMTLFIYKEIFVDGCYDLPLPTAPSVIVDVGANTGLFMIRMKQLYPDARIRGYEPLPSNYAQLRRNLELSALDKVETRMQGVGGTTRKEKLYVHPSNIGGHSIHRSLAGGGRHIEIDLIGVRELLDSLEGRRCGVLKLDCEGAELEIIESIDQEMARRIDNVVFEPTPSLYDVSQLVEHLKSVGYRVGSYKGLCWARR